MSAEAYRDEEMYKEAEPNVISIKRNPYLVDYEQQRRLREHREQRMPRGEQGAGRISQGGQRTLQGMQRNSRGEQRLSQGAQRFPQRAQRESQREQAVRRVPRRESQREQEVRRVPRREFQREQEITRRQEMRRDYRRTSQRMPQRGYSSQREIVRRTNTVQYTDDNALSQAQRKRVAIEKRRAAARRRQIVRMQRLVLYAGVFCIALLCGILYMKRIDAKEEESGNKEVQTKVTGDILPEAPSSGLIQGLPAAEFAKHPDWEENLLTPNEYSRPGDTLEEVNNIFVHYTANPNTSAAQNRSYFEQLKDTHITSASAHFIIGYNGEIVQCIPLDEIAYAVQTRNFDSVSIECCYKAADGSFTQETYDSLIDLLAWLTEVYDLETDDILRHYDCGGKKCPIYYTEHEDAWVRLKEDVREQL